MKGTSGEGKAAAGANDIMGVTESRVKSFLRTFIKIGQFGKSFRSFSRNIDSPGWKQTGMHRSGKVFFISIG
jgi:hypothetical protein